MNDSVFTLVSGMLHQIVQCSGLQLEFALRRQVGCFEVNFSGPDTPMLMAHDAELLRALEHVATQALRLHPNEEDRLSFAVEGFRAEHADLMLHAE